MTVNIKPPRTVNTKPPKRRRYLRRGQRCFAGGWAGQRRWRRGRRWGKRRALGLRRGAADSHGAMLLLYVMAAIGGWLAIDWRLMVDGWWLAVGIGRGRLDSGCRSYGQGYFACRFRVLVFHAPAHCWTGIERWERPRRGLTHPRGIEAECVPDPTMVAIPTVLAVLS